LCTFAVNYDGKRERERERETWKEGVENQMVHLASLVGVGRESRIVARPSVCVGARACARACVRLRVCVRVCVGRSWQGMVLAVHSFAIYIIDYIIFLGMWHCLVHAVRIGRRRRRRRRQMAALLREKGLGPRGAALWRDGRPVMPHLPACAPCFVRRRRAGRRVRASRPAQGPPGARGRALVAVPAKARAAVAVVLLRAYDAHVIARARTHTCAR
jgi:hypothetical protein